MSCPPSILGGQERVALGLATAQHAQGDEVLVVSIAPPPEGPIGRELREAGVRAETLAKRSNLDPSLPLRLAALLGRQGAEIVHTHNPQALIYGALAGRLAGARVVHTKHGINPDRARRVWLRRAAARLVDAYVVVTPALATNRHPRMRPEPGPRDPERHRHHELHSPPR